ncbi:Na(+)/H(+) exchanger beta-like isoform X2 [Oreochromis niloticus]|uniref:Na(+)/H(+) exchanger beta-like isoform X2 n=1 Tax=Oreochromis niloticus TaxID=8128 RepID=UPI000DF3251F|nr:Na(+)/H(+) exchanger beta-like isoform X2 [Oreochromis niloticus]CAI5691452.1 unnamed protein product [Mustela putorius furo]
MDNRLAMLLLMVLGLAHDVTSSNHPSPPTAHATSANISTNGTGRIFPLLYLDYGKVQISFEVAMWILLASLLKLGFHRLPHISTHVPDRCLFIVVGLVFGGLFRAGGQGVPQILHKLFFLCLLPPIILDAGYFLPIEPLFKNLGRVLLFGFVGSIWNGFFVGGILYGVCRIGTGSTVLTNTGLLQCLLFGSITSAVDSAAVFEKIQMKDILHILLFGESILSDAVAVVLYHLYHEFHVTASVTFMKVFLGVIAFSLAGLGGILVGSCYGILTAFTTRFTSNTGIVEPLVVFLFCNLAYLSADMFNLSGIIALISCCVVMRPFVQANISCESEMTIKYFLKMWSRFNESLIFIFVGVVTVAGPQVWNWTFITLTVILCVVARVIAVVGLTFLTNKFHSVKLTKEDQFLFVCSGLRGGVAFFLAFLLEKDHFPEKEIFVTAIITVIFFTIFVQCMAIKPLMKLLAVKKNQLATDQEIRTQVFHRLGLHIDGVCGDNGHHHRMDKLKQFSDLYLKKWLIAGEGKMEEQEESGGGTELPSAVPSTVSMQNIQQLSEGQYQEIHESLQNLWILLQRTRQRVETGGGTELPSTLSMQNIQQLSEGEYQEIHESLQNSWILLQRTRQRAERMRKEEADAQRKADDDAKKIAK